MTDQAGGRWHHRRVSDMEPRVSVIMAVYNGERYLREAVGSILVQSLPDLELIVVNDGSSDKTGEILASCTDPRILRLAQRTKRWPSRGAQQSY